MSDKITKSYNLLPENIAWLKEQGESAGRSASSFLDRLLTTHREKTDGKAKQKR